MERSDEEILTKRTKVVWMWIFQGISTKSTHLCSYHPGYSAFPGPPESPLVPHLVITTLPWRSSDHLHPDFCLGTWYNGIIQCMFFRVWHLLFSSMFVQLTCVVLCNWSSFMLRAAWEVIVWLYHFLYPSCCRWTFEFLIRGLLRVVLLLASPTCLYLSSLF